MHILLVDDEKHFVSALAERLTMRGMPADWTDNAKDALELAKKNHYDLAILDVKMPHVGGIDLKYKLAEIHPEMRFIFFTGHGSEEDFRVGSAEASCYLVKPLSIDQLMEKIQGTMTGCQLKE